MAKSTDIYIGHNFEKGLGLYAKNAIASESYICEYVGQVILRATRDIARDEEITCYYGKGDGTKCLCGAGDKYQGTLPF